jgi:predicted nucleic acid-binding protein
VVLIDTSVWITVLRDKTGGTSDRLQAWLADREPLLTRFSQLELLQGCRDEQEWALLGDYLHGQAYVEARTSTWPSAARIYFELRRAGKTVRSPIDCCIAQLALENQLMLIHDDRDFEVIAELRPLSQLRWEPAMPRRG